MKVICERAKICKYAKTNECGHDEPHNFFENGCKMGKCSEFHDYEVGCIEIEFISEFFLDSEDFEI